jgi:hypothetical protein
MPPFFAACCRLFCSPCELQRPRMMFEEASPTFWPTGEFDEMAAPLLMVAQLQSEATTKAAEAAIVIIFFIMIVFLKLII